MVDLFKILKSNDKIDFKTDYYNKKGDVVVKESDNAYVFASSSVITHRDGHLTYKYFILYNNYGPEAGQPVNPNTALDDALGRTYNTKLGRSRHELREVKKQQFNLYLKFLKTQNAGYLKELERIY